MSTATLLSATQARQLIDSGALRRVDVIDQCLARVERCESTLRAFAGVDGDAARSAAAEYDRHPTAGLLCGVPIGVKDVFATADLATCFNSPLYDDYVPNLDAACVAILRARGAIVFGKTATVEFASLGRVADTTNPHDPTRTPGGSSSGSAAAVAAGMVPIALATQTGGSTIRPASFCGVAGFKPTYGRVAIDGMRAYAPSLDTIGWMARCVDDVLLLATAFGLTEEATEAAAAAPTIGVYHTPYWQQADAASREALQATASALREAGARIVDVAGPNDAERLNEAQNTLMHGEGRAAYLNEYLRWPDQLHPKLREEVENALGITPEAMRWAYDYLGSMRPAFDQAMQGFDAWLTPAVPGEAPIGLASTGDAVFNRLWTGLHMPSITLPGFQGPNGLPVGVQLVATRYADTRLLQVAAFTEAAIKAQAWASFPRDPVAVTDQTAPR